MVKKCHFKIWFENKGLFPLDPSLREKELEEMADTVSDNSYFSKKRQF